MTKSELEELKRQEFIESCADDGYGPRLRALREKLAKASREPVDEAPA